MPVQCTADATATCAIKWHGTCWKQLPDGAERPLKCQLPAPTVDAEAALQQQVVQAILGRQAQLLLHAAWLLLRHWVSAAIRAPRASARLGCFSN